MRTEKQQPKKVRRQRGDAANASTSAKGRFRPNYAVAPGETLSEMLESRGMTQVELVQATSRSKKTINEIINGRAAITGETAIRLERALGVPASFWNNLERNYRETLACLRREGRT